MYINTFFVFASMMNLRSPPDATWRQLQFFVSEDRRYAGKLWKELERRPFTIDSLEDIAERDIPIIFCNIEEYGRVEIAKRENEKTTIKIRKKLHPYDRDKTLFHELMHLWYEPYLADGDDVKHIDRRLRNAARAEYLASQARADSQLLHKAITVFKLKPYIYDKVSYDAFAYISNFCFSREKYMYKNKD